MAGCCDRAAFCGTVAVVVYYWSMRALPVAALPIADAALRSTHSAHDSQTWNGLTTGTESRAESRGGVPFGGSGIGGEAACAGSTQGIGIGMSGEC